MIASEQPDTNSFESYEIYCVDIFWTETEAPRWLRQHRGMSALHSPSVELVATLDHALIFTHTFFHTHTTFSLHHTFSLSHSLSLSHTHTHRILILPFATWSYHWNSLVSKSGCSIPVKEMSWAGCWIKQSRKAELGPPPNPRISQQDHSQHLANHDVRARNPQQTQTQMKFTDTRKTLRQKSSATGFNRSPHTNSIRAVRIKSLSSRSHCFQRATQTENHPMEVWTLSRLRWPRQRVAILIVQGIVGEQTFLRARRLHVND